MWRDYVRRVVFREPHAVGLVSMLERSPDKLLIVEDDEQLRQCLAGAMAARGFQVITAGSVGEGLRQVESNAPVFAVVDLRLPDGCGLIVVEALKRRGPDTRIVVLTGYGNIATAVSAAKIGAVDYLTKPASAEEIASVLRTPEGGKSLPPQQPMTADRVRWEHIQNFYRLYGCNVSEAARRLTMHRRTLQRVLAKGTPR
jgi:two-component system, response regulator RegA